MKLNSKQAKKLTPPANTRKSSRLSLSLQFPPMLLPTQQLIDSSRGPAPYPFTDFFQQLYPTMHLKARSRRSVHLRETLNTSLSKQLTVTTLTLFPSELAEVRVSKEAAEDLPVRRSFLLKRSPIVSLQPKTRNGPQGEQRATADGKSQLPLMSPILRCPSVEFDTLLKFCHFALTHGPASH